MKPVWGIRLAIAVLVSLVGCAPRPRTYDRVTMERDPGDLANSALLIRGPSNHRYHGREFEFDPHRTVIAIDLDDCVIKTQYSTAIFTRFDHVSQPCDHALATIQALSKDYDLIYISARPWFYYPGTRWWLNRAGFPPAPIVHSTHLWNLVAQRRYKIKLLREMQQKIPNLLIGIGDRYTDIAGYRSNGMLAINVNPDPKSNTGHDAIFVSDWSGVAAIFADNHDILTDPASVRAVLRGDIRLRLPLFRHGEPQPVQSPPCNTVCR